jgi:hypothetical protein
MLTNRHVIGIDFNPAQFCWAIFATGQVEHAFS